MNLSVIRRYVPNATAIVATAPYIVVYNFNNDTIQWDRLNIEGTLFICALNGSTPTLGDNSSGGQRGNNRRGRRSKKDVVTPVKGRRQNQHQGPEEYTVIVLNRRSLDNFIIPLTSPQDIEGNSDRYIIIRSRTPPQTSANPYPATPTAAESGPADLFTYGIWVWTDIPSTSGDKERIANVLTELSTRVSKTSQNQVQSPTTQQTEEEEQEYVEQVQQQQEQQRVQEQAVSGQPDQFVENVEASAPAAEAIPMNSRSISLTALFQQQRLEDSGFATHSHIHHQPQQQQQQQQQPPPPIPQQLLHQQQPQYPSYFPEQQYYPPPPQQQPSPFQSQFNNIHQHIHHTPTSFQQHYTQHSHHQSMPPPPHYLPTPGPPSTGPMFPTPPPPPPPPPQQQQQQQQQQQPPPQHLQHLQNHPHYPQHLQQQQQQQQQRPASSTTSSSQLPPVMHYHQQHQQHQQLLLQQQQQQQAPPILTGYNVVQLQSSGVGYPSSGMPPRPEYPIIPGGGGGGTGPGSAAGSSVAGGASSIRGAGVGGGGGGDMLARLFQNAAAEARMSPAPQGVGVGGGGAGRAGSAGV
ncbi:hypothetical protein DFH27DRAFT_523427 [Peziza echinospora]|nr:hypothetical protein DFH27DRAFT_523427 [Peziza echinospora]